MKFGAHISGAGGLEYIPEKAHRLGCETFQFFSRSPRGGSKTLLDETVQLFRANTSKLGFSTYYIHAPYYINLASKDSKIYNGSIEVLKDELIRANKLGVRGVITHIGSAKGMARAKAVSRVVTGVRRILEDASAILFLEISAGAGDVIGSAFEELNDIYTGALKQNKESEPHLRIALDTAHMFASGYDIRTKKGLADVLDAYNKYFSIENLEVMHVNDSKVYLGEHKDRHEEIGKGKLGLEAFRVFVNEPRLKNLHAILETPKESDEDDLRNLAALRNLVGT